MALRVINIAPGTSADGPGLRTSIYFAGCDHRCPGCHNPASWPFDAGEEKSVEDLMKVIQYNRFHVTFSGGDPMYQAAELLPLAKAITEMGLKIWYAIALPRFPFSATMIQNSKGIFQWGILLF